MQEPGQLQSRDRGMGAQRPRGGEELGCLRNREEAGTKTAVGRVKKEMGQPLRYAGPHRPREPVWAALSVR